MGALKVTIIKQPMTEIADVRYMTFPKVNKDNGRTEYEYFTTRFVTYNNTTIIAKSTNGWYTWMKYLKDVVVDAIVEDGKEIELKRCNVRFKSYCDETRELTFDIIE